MSVVLRTQHKRIGSRWAAHADDWCNEIDLDTDPHHIQTPPFGRLQLYEHTKGTA